MEREQDNRIYKNLPFEEKGEPRLNDQGETVHRYVPAAGTIVLTAVSFMLVGMVIACCVILCLFITGDISFGDVGYEVILPTEDVIQTPLPQEGAVQTPSYGVVTGLPELIERVMDGVVMVESYEGSTASEFSYLGMGTGFVMDDSGIVLTNHHVIDDAGSIYVTFSDGRSAKAELVGSDERTDIAVLRFEPEGFNYLVLEMGNSKNVRVGDFVIAIGHPTGEELKFSSTFGMVGAVEREINIDGVANKYIQIDAAINPGNSGGPLFDMNGLVIGINTVKTITASYDENGLPITAEGLGFALPISNVMDIAEEIIETGGAKHPGMGVSLIEVSGERADMYGVPQGLLVYYVVDGGPAFWAGLRANDIILEINGVTMDSMDALDIVQSEFRVGGTVSISFYRNGEMLECNLKLKDLNSIGDAVYNDEYGGDIVGFG